MIFLYLCANILQKSMKIALFQTDIRWNDPQWNTEHAAQMMEEMRLKREDGRGEMEEEADVYVLPEMFTTGFATQPEGIADDKAKGLKWMRQMARQHDAAIVGSIATNLGNGKYCNRMYFVMPDGTEVHYDKRHLFSYGGEDEHYTSGTERVTVEWRGVRFLLQVCYDLRFPVWSRNHEDYDCALYVANWPESRIGAWKTLLKARAIENQCYVCGVNRVGTDAACKYSGGTTFIDPYGRVVAEVEDGKEGWIVAELNMEKLTQFREKFPVLKDRD